MINRLKYSKSDAFFFPSLAILISATGFAGFSFTYFGPILKGTYPTTGFPLHLHGWSFFLWYLLFPLQAILISAGWAKPHRALGRLSAILVVLMVFTGVLVLSVRVEEAVRQGAPEIWLLYGPMIFSNLVLFTGFYTAGIIMVFKKRFEAHKRLIVVASAIGLGAGFFRLILFLSGFHPLSVPMGIFSCGLFILIGIVYDRVVYKSVHPVYWTGLLALVLVQGFLLPQMNAEAVKMVNEWLAGIGETLIFLYQPDPTVEF